MTLTNEVTLVDPARRAHDDRAINGTFLIESGWVDRARRNTSGSRIHWTT